MEKNLIIHNAHKTVIVNLMFAIIRKRFVLYVGGIKIVQLFLYALL